MPAGTEASIVVPSAEEFVLSDLSSGTEPATMVQSPANRGLKAVVILLGALIVIALGLLVAGFAMRLSGKGAGSTGNEHVLTLAPGTEIQTMEVADRRLVLRLKTVDGEEIAIVDTTDGHLIGRVRTAAPLR
jgi:hypothetical protein